MSDDRISIRISRVQKEKLKNLGGGSITQGFAIVMTWLDSTPPVLDDASPPPHPNENIENSKNTIIALEERIHMLENDEFWMSGADSREKITKLRRELERKKNNLKKVEFEELDRLIQGL